MQPLCIDIMIGFIKLPSSSLRFSWSWWWTGHITDGFVLIGTSSSGPPVTQTPGFSVVEEGETVRINCCWTVDFEMMTLIWLKDGASIKSERHQRPSRCSDLTFRQVTRNDTGTYICKLTVEAPKYATHEGNATVITIMTRDNTNNSNTGGGRRNVTQEPVDFWNISHSFLMPSQSALKE